MAAAAVLERVKSPEADFESLKFEVPEALVVPEMLIDLPIRERAAQFIGSVALNSCQSAELSAAAPAIESLHEAIQLAAAGDRTARSLVETNVRTDVIERTTKTGHVSSPVPLTVTAEGRIVQFGQTAQSIQANSLRYAAEHPIMRERIEAETRNAFRIEELHRAGFFEDYSFVVISRAEDLPEAGFFTDTMSCALQLTAKRGDGLITESAFVAGIAAPGELQHDAATVVKLGARLGADLSGKTPAEIIDTPLLVHSSLLPNGAIDLVKMYDEAAGGTFFGEARPAQDYLEYLKLCRRRELSFEPKVRQIVAELLAEAGSIASPVQATDRLHHLSEKHMVEQAVADTSIDPRVFGSAAASHIEIARLAAVCGDYEARDKAMQQAQATARSSSCPAAGRMVGSPDNNETAATNQPEADEDCDFISKKCPLCGEKNVKTKVTKTHIIGACGCRKKK